MRLSLATTVLTVSLLLGLAGCASAAPRAPQRAPRLERLAVSSLAALRLGDSIRAPAACQEVARHADIVTASGLAGRFERYMSCPPDATGGWYARLSPDAHGRLRDVFLQTTAVSYRAVRDSVIRRFGAPQCRRPPTAPGEFLGWSDGERVLWVSGDSTAAPGSRWVQLYWFESAAAPCDARRSWG